MHESGYRVLLFVLGGPFVGACSGGVLGLVFNSGIQRTLVQEITVYVVAGAGAGLLLGIGLAILSLARMSNRDSEPTQTDQIGQGKTTAQSRSRSGPVVQFIIIIGVIIFLLRLLMIITIGK